MATPADVQCAGPTSTSNRRETAMIPYSELFGATLALIIVGFAYIILYFVM